VDHADEFGTLVVHGRGVEIVDAQIALRLHRVGERAGILGELDRAQGADIADAADRGAPWSAENNWSRNTVSPSFSDSWNQSRQVTRLPVQL
jgi:hypothetical protein